MITKDGRFACDLLELSRLTLAAGGALMASVAIACNSEPPEPDGPSGVVGEDATGGTGAQAASGGASMHEPPALDVGPDEGMGGAPASPAITIIEELPSGFARAEGAADGSDATELRGGYRLVGPLAALESEEEETACANVLRVVMRDFKTFEHPDFGGSKSPPHALGLVLGELGADRKPVRSEAYPAVALQLEDWYTNVPDTNVPYVVDLWLEPDGEAFVFDSSRFFPLDSVAEEEDKHQDDDGVLRNFGFTTELHTAFQYQGGEIFTFRGDDDVFVFVDGQLVVDLGGVHNPIEGSVEIDSLGLTVGEVYHLDLFQAERNPTGSNFRLETTLDFTECGTVLPNDIIVR